MAERDAALKQRFRSTTDRMRMEVVCMHDDTRILILARFVAVAVELVTYVLPDLARRARHPCCAIVVLDCTNLCRAS